MKIKYLAIFFTIIFGFNYVTSQTDTSEILLEGTVSVENNQIKNLADPTDENDAVNKDYLDQIINYLQSQIDELQEIIFNNLDNDGDGYSVAQGDCDDNNASINPNAIENCDGIDNNCNGSIDENAAESMGLGPCVECENGQIVTTSGNPCNDFNACTSGDVCNQGACVGNVINCDDGNPCTNDSCDPVNGCTFTPNNNACDDGDACTSGDSCVQGACVSGSYNDCDDGNPCTTDYCDPQIGCVNTPNSNACSDGNACTTGDVCNQGICVGGNVINCDDGNACTSDSCDPVYGCVNTNTQSGTACDDGDPCTVNDMCINGVCSGAAYTCNDGDPCTYDICNGDGSCSNIPIEDCDD